MNVLVRTLSSRIVLVSMALATFVDSHSEFSVDLRVSSLIENRFDKVWENALYNVCTRNAAVAGVALI